MQIQLVNKSSFISETFELERMPYNSVSLQINGAATVSLQCKGIDGVWRGWPEVTFTGDTAQLLALSAGEWRIVIGSGTPTTVSIQW